jgi:hypothetical protein
MRLSSNSLKFPVSLLLILLFTRIAAPQTPQQTPEARKFAEFYSSTNPIEMMKQLNSFADLLRKEPQARAWLLDYEGTILPGAAVRLSFTVENYLSGRGGIENFRLTRAGGRRQGESKLELWYVPTGADYPKLSNEAVTSEGGAAYKWDEQYYLLQEEKAALKGVEAETLDSNYYNDHTTFLDSFRSELVLPQAGRGRIVIYPKRGDPPDLPQKIADYERRYLLRRHFIAPSMVSLEIGEPRERRKVELWIVPSVIPILMSDFAPADSTTTDPRLADLVTALQNLKGVQAGSKILVIAYTGAFTDAQNIKRQVNAQAILEEIKKSLVQKYRVAPDRIIAIDGGKQKEGGVELWIIPPGAIEPAPKLAEP